MVCLSVFLSVFIRLEEKAQLKEEALSKSELMLQADALRFDAFLKENDKKAHDALKRYCQQHAHCMEPYYHHSLQHVCLNNTVSTCECPRWQG